MDGSVFAGLPVDSLPHVGDGRKRTDLRLHGGQRLALYKARIGSHVQNDELGRRNQRLAVVDLGGAFGFQVQRTGGDLQNSLAAVINVVVSRHVGALGIQNRDLIDIVGQGHTLNDSPGFAAQLHVNFVSVYRRSFIDLIATRQSGAVIHAGQTGGNHLHGPPVDGKAARLHRDNVVGRHVRAIRIGDLRGVRHVFVHNGSLVGAGNRAVCLQSQIVTLDQADGARRDPVLDGGQGCPVVYLSVILQLQGDFARYDLQHTVNVLDLVVGGNVGITAEERNRYLVFHV